MTTMHRSHTDPDPTAGTSAPPAGRGEAHGATARDAAANDGALGGLVVADRSRAASAPTLDAALRRWLAIEAVETADTVHAGAMADTAPAAGREGATDPDAAAEAALAALLTALPQASPPSGFASRVMARVASPQVAVVPAVAARPAMAARARRRERSVAVLALAAAALVMSWTLWLPPVLTLVSPAHLGLLVEGLVTAVLSVARVVADLVSLGDSLLLVVRAVSKPLATPPVAALAAASLAVSFLALRFLHALIQRDRRWVYADPI
jgi:hypothetical protein